jgi:Kelch motif protein
VRSRNSKFLAVIISALGLSLGTALAAGGTFQSTGSMTTVRDGYNPYIEPGQTSPFTATRLNDGTVMIAGGADANGQALTTAEIYNPSTGSFISTGSMTYPRKAHTATLLTSGKGANRRREPNLPASSGRAL